MGFRPQHQRRAHLLRIVSAKFNFKNQAGQPKSVLVASNIQLAEAFSAYDDGKTSFLDLFHRPLGMDRRADLTIHPKPQLEQCVLPGKTVSWSRDAKLKILARSP